MTKGTPGEKAIRIEGLTREFGPVRAVDTLSLEVSRGTIFGFLGPNGSGKTTTIRLLLGLLEPTTGQAEVLGRDIRTQGDQIRRRSGVLLEDSGLYERLSAEDNLEFYGRVWHLSKSERRSRIKELLQHFDLWQRRKETVVLWSRGMRQKLAIARALLHRPALLFLDEPTAGLDPIAALALGDDLVALAEREGVTIFLTTHDLVAAERFCDEVGVLRQGTLLTVASPEMLRAAAGATRIELQGQGFDETVLALTRAQSIVTRAELEHDRLIVELCRGASPASLIRVLVSAGAELEEVRRNQPSLEQIYLELMAARQ